MFTAFVYLLLLLCICWLLSTYLTAAAQMKEIEEECGKLPSAVAVPSRLLRSEQKKQALVSASAGGGGDNEDEGEEGEEVVGGMFVCM